jgi:hypothetical protein
MLLHTKTPDGEAEGLFAVGVRVLFYQIVCDLGSEEVKNWNWFTGYDEFSGWR